MFTREKIQKLHQLSDAFIAQKELASETLRTAQDRFKHRTVKLEREGQEIELTEKVLWDEVFLMGLGNHQAANELKKLHPEVFEAFATQDKLAEELKVYGVTELGVDYTKMSISDYLRLTEGMFEIMMHERGEATKSPIQE